MRYLKVTLLCGFLASLLAAGFYQLHLFDAADWTVWNWLGRPSQPPAGARSWIQYLVFILLAFGVAWTTVDINRVALKWIVALGVLLEVLATTAIAGLYHHYFSPFASLTAIVLSFIFGLIYARTEAGKRKRIARMMFGNRLSHANFARLVDSDEPLLFDGEKRELSLVACGLMNREALADSLTASDYVAMTNYFLQTVSEFLVNGGAYLNECAGDFVGAIYGAPMRDAGHAVDACKAALELSSALEVANDECEKKWNAKWRFSIGVHSGETVLAAYGSERLAAFTVSGELVEFAKKLSEANLVYGTQIAVSQRTLVFAGEKIEVRPLDLVRYHDARGREEVYELLAISEQISEESRARRDAFWRGVVLSREGRWEEALEQLRSSLAEGRQDPLAEFHIRRVEAAQKGKALSELEHARF